MKRKDGFAPIGSYAAIGDGRTVALVAADGSVDFMSLPSLHAPTTFAALLDPERGGRFTLAAGEQAVLALVAAHEQPLHAPSRDHVEARLDATCRVWERWLGFWAYDGPWEEEVARSALALKLLVYAPNGSIAAAPTTSLPEVIGGDKNYDYRYSWVRDSAFTLDALMRLGLPEQVQESFGCL